MEITTNAPDVAAKFEKLIEQLKFQQSDLFAEIGRGLVADTQKRIISQDQGRWAGLSKWALAKKAAERPLQGAEKFVKSRIAGNKLEIYGDTGANWTLTQHDQGFENKEDHREGDRIIIDIVNPSPLGITKAGPFSWVPEKGEVFKTPARKIWATGEEAKVIVMPIASHWLEAVAQKVFNG